MTLKTKYQILMALFFVLIQSLGHAFDPTWFLHPKEVRKALKNKSDKTPKLTSIDEPFFKSWLGDLVTDRDSTNLYRVESKVETLENHNGFETSRFVEHINSILGSEPLSYRNGDGFITVTEQRKLSTKKDTGEVFRNVKIRTRAYMTPEASGLKPKKGYKWDYSPAHFIRLFDHADDDISVRLEFKIDAVDSVSQNLLEGVVEKPFIICTKKDADILLNTNSSQDEIAHTAQKILRYEQNNKPINNKEQITSFLNAIMFLKRQNITISKPHEVSIYKRIAYLGPNGIQITVDQDIRYIDAIGNLAVYDFPKDARVVELKVPLDMMKIILETHADTTNNNTKITTSTPYYKEYLIWRAFEEIPAAPGTKRNSGKTTRGKRAIKKHNKTFMGRCQMLFSQWK